MVIEYMCPMCEIPLEAIEIFDASHSWELHCPKCNYSRKCKCEHCEVD